MEGREKYGDGFLLIITGWGEAGKVILQVSTAVFFGRCRKIFRAKMAQRPWKNLARTPMVRCVVSFPKFHYNNLLQTCWPCR